MLRFHSSLAINSIESGGGERGRRLICAMRSSCRCNRSLNGKQNKINNQRQQSSGGEVLSTALWLHNSSEFPCAVSRVDSDQVDGDRALGSHFSPFPTIRLK